MCTQKEITVRLLGLDDDDLMPRLEEVESCGRSWLRVGFDPAEWQHGGFHYTRSALELRELMTRFKAKILVALRGQEFLGYAIFFDQVIPRFEDDTDPEWADDRWIDDEEWRTRGGVPDVYHYQIAVRSDVLNKGVGRALHAEFVRIATANGGTLACCEILRSADGKPCENTASRRFHEALGWQFNEEHLMDDPGFTHPSRPDVTTDLVWTEPLLPLRR